MRSGLAEAGLGPDDLSPNRPAAALFGLTAQPDGDVFVLVGHAEAARPEVGVGEIPRVDCGRFVVCHRDVAGYEERVALPVAESVAENFQNKNFRFLF